MQDKGLKIMYDYQMFVLQRFGGISRYIADLIAAYRETHNVYTPLLWSRNFYMEKLTGAQSSRFAMKKWSRLIVIPVNILYSIYKLMVIRPDILHLSYYNSYLVPFLPKRTNLVVTAHDMIHEIYPDLFSKFDLTTAHKRRVFNRADAIIAISKNTKNDLVKYFDVAPEKISVIYHGSPLAKTNEKTDFTKHDNYFLFVGQRDKYKNFETLVDGLAPIMIQEKMNLLCIGGKPFSDKELYKFKALGIEGMVKKETLNDEGLQKAYTQAFCMVYPSAYEGFGIPILEAWSCGCPVVLSRAACFQEIAGDAAIYFETFDAQNLRKKAESLLYDNDLRTRLIKRGYESVKNFTVKKMATQTFSLYNQLLKS